MRDFLFTKTTTRSCLFLEMGCQINFGNLKKKSWPPNHGPPKYGPKNLDLLFFMTVFKKKHFPHKKMYFTCLIPNDQGTNFCCKFSCTFHLLMDCFHDKIIYKSIISCFVLLKCHSNRKSWISFISTPPSLLKIPSECPTWIHQIVKIIQNNFQFFNQKTLFLKIHDHVDLNRKIICYITCCNYCQYCWIILSWLAVEKCNIEWWFSWFFNWQEASWVKKKFQIIIFRKSFGIYFNKTDKYTTSYFGFCCKKMKLKKSSSDITTIGK